MPNGDLLRIIDEQSGEIIRYLYSLEYSVLFLSIVSPDQDLVGVFLSVS